MQPFTHQNGQTIGIEGAEIYVEAGTNVTDPALFLLHGGFGTMEDFNPILPKLPPGFRVVAIDSRGHGKSTLGPQPLTYQRLQRDVEAVAAHLQIKHCHIIGFSDGGIVGYRLAAEKTLKVDSLVTLGARFELKENSPARPFLLKATPDSWRNRFPDTVALYQRLNPHPDFETFGRAVVQMWRDVSESGYPGNELASIACKVLAVRGNEDHLLNLDELVRVSKQVKGAIPFNVPFASHTVHRDQPEIVMQAVNLFLAKQ